MTIPLVFVLAAIASAPPCHPVEGERITSRDLAAADARLASLPATAELGFAPAPGVRRIVHASEIARFAARFGVPSDGLPDLCFERPVHALDPAELVAAMQSSLGDAAARIEIVDVMRYAVPAGSIEFPRTGLTTPVPGRPKIATLWRGYVLTSGGRRFPIWATVKIEGLANAPGTQEVARGDRVTVSVREGGAHLKFEGRSEAPGRIGQTIPVRNTASGKTFMAQVSGTGKVSVGDTPQP